MFSSAQALRFWHKRKSISERDLSFSNSNVGHPWVAVGCICLSTRLQRPGTIKQKRATTIHPSRFSSFIK